MCIFIFSAAKKMANDLIMRGKDRLQEISMKVEQSHLVYLHTDDSPLKLQQRHKLEGNGQLSTFSDGSYNYLEFLVL